MAISICFGLAFATALILLFTPACLSYHQSLNWPSPCRPPSRRHQNPRLLQGVIFFPRPTQKRDGQRQSKKHLAPQFTPPFHSREGGNLCGDSRIRRQATISLHEISRCRGKRFPPSREWKGGREWNDGRNLCRENAYYLIAYFSLKPLINVIMSAMNDSVVLTPHSFDCRHRRRKIPLICRGFLRRNFLGKRGFNRRRR